MQNNQYPYSAHFPDQARKNSKPSFWKRLMGEFDPTPQAPPPQAAPYTPYPIGQASGGQQSNGQGQDQAAEEARQRELKEKEEEELQLALALSLSEEEAKKGRQTGLYHQFGTNPTSTSAPIKTNEPKRVNGSSSATPSDMYIYRGVAQENPQRNGDDEEDIDPALSRYLDKRYWEQRQAARDAETTATMNQANDMMNVRATAPPASEYSFSTSSGDPNINDFGYMAYNNGTQQQQPSASNGVANGYEFNTAPIEKKMSNMTIESKAAESNDEIDQTLAFCKNLREQVEIMDNRMRSNLMRGRSVVNDSAIHSLFKQLTSRHADVLNRMGKLDSDREFFEGLQDHLAYIQEARQALESLREENLKQRQERLQEEQRLRMQQMQAKLEQIRHKKYEALCEQRLMALQRLQDEENRIQQGRNAEKSIKED